MAATPQDQLKEVLAGLPDYKPAAGQPAPGGDPLSQLRDVLASLPDDKPAAFGTPVNRPVSAIPPALVSAMKQRGLPPPPPPAPPDPVGEMRANPVKPTQVAVMPEPPAPLPPPVSLSPAGRSTAPVPGRIPGMERLGGVAPGVPPVRNPMQSPPARQPYPVMADGTETLVPPIDEYVISDEPFVPAVVRGLSGATVGSVGGILKSIGDADTSQSPGGKFLRPRTPVGTAPQDNPAQNTFRSAGDAMLAADKSVQETFARDASIKNFMDDPAGAMGDPRWWMDTVGSAAGSMVPMAAAGAGASAGIARIASMNAVPPQVAKVAAQYGPSVVAGLTESVQVFGNTYAEAVAAGIRPELAKEAAALVAAVTGLTAIPAHMVGIFNDKIRSVGRKIATSAAAEGGQEGAQTWWENVVAKLFYDPDRPLMQSVPEGIVGAFIVGAPMGAVGVNEQRSTSPAPAEDAQKQLQQVIAELPPMDEPVPPPPAPPEPPASVAGQPLLPSPGPREEVVQPQPVAPAAPVEVGPASPGAVEEAKAPAPASSAAPSPQSSSGKISEWKPFPERWSEGVFNQRWKVGNDLSYEIIPTGLGEYALERTYSRSQWDPATIETVGRFKTHELAESAAEDDAREYYEFDDETVEQPSAAQVDDIPQPPAPQSPGRVGETWQDKNTLRIRTSDLSLDPVRFQYKVENIGQGGVTDTLKDVAGWDDAAAGTIFVWKDPADGKTYVVNGHHRFDLARRLGQPDLRISYIDAKTAKEARAAGALQNIREGNGSAIDAAKFMRDTGMTVKDLAANRISIKGPIAKQAAGLSNLAPSLFDDVVHGNLDAKRAAIIGEGLPSFDDQKAVLRIIEKQEAKGKNPTDAEVKEMIRLASGGERVKVKDDGQEVLFPEDDSADDSRSLIYEISQLSSFVRTRLSQEKKLFGLVGKQSAAERLSAAGNEIKAETNQKIADEAKQVLAAYDKLSERTGPISDALVQGARRIANGEKLDVVKEDTYASIRDSVARLIPGLRENPERQNLRADDEAGDQQRPEGVQGKPGRGLSGTVEQVGGVKQETLVSDREARESQIAAKADRNRPLAEVPFSLVAEEAPAPSGPDERQASMFGDDEEGSGTLAYRPPDPNRPPRPATQQQGPAGTVGKMVSRRQIVGELSSSLGGVPIRTGNFAERAAGIYKVRESVIRSKRPLDIGTIAHEIGHAMHKYFWGTTGNPNRLNSGPLRRFRSELGPLDYDPQKARVFEGFAEYTRLFLINPAEANRRAPQFDAWFRNELQSHREVSQALQDIAKHIADWERQPAPVKLGASIDTTSGKKSAIQRALQFGKDWKFEMVDRYNDLKKVVEMFSKNGAQVEAAKNAYVMARLLSAAYTRAHYALTDAMIDNNYNRVGPSLQSILKPIAKRKASERNPRFQRLSEEWGLQVGNDNLDDLRMYLVARRLMNYHENDLESPFTRGEIQQAIDATKTPAIEAAAKAIHDFQSQVIEYMVAKGALSQETADKFREKNQFYVPMYRVMDHTQTEKNMPSRNMLDINSPIMRRKGSQRDIIDPLESIVRNTYMLFSFTERNNVGQVLVKQAERTSNQGDLVESGIVRPKKRTEFSLEEVKKQITDVLEANDVELPEDIDWEVAAAVYDQNMSPDARNGIHRITVDGKQKLFQLADPIARAMGNMDTHSANLFVKFARPAKNLLTFTAAAGSPEFVLTNFLRDQAAAGIQSRNGYIPFYHGVIGAFHLLTNKPLVDEWILNGGASATLMPLGRDSMQLSINRMTMPRKELILRHPGEFFDLLKEVITTAGTYSEQATRLGEYRLARKKGKDKVQSVMDSRDVSLDFERMGRTSKAVNEMVPFFAVSINALDRFSEMHNPKNPEMFRRTMAIGAGLAAASFALWWINKDDEEYYAQEDWKRDMYYLIPTKGLGLRGVFGPFIRIPKPPIWGQLYGASTERIASALYKMDRSAFDGFAATMAQQLLPPMSIQLFRPIQEAQSNYIDFTDRPVESQAQQRYSPGNRYSPSTSEAAKAFSKAFGKVGIEVSPLKVEHVMFGYTSGLGRFVVTATEELLGLRKDRPSLGPADRPLLRALSTPESPYISTDYKRFTERRQKLSQKKNDFKLTGEPKYQLTPAEDDDLKELNRLAKELQGISRERMEAEKSTKLSRDQKRARIDLLMKKRDTMLRANRNYFAGTK